MKAKNKVRKILLDEIDKEERRLIRVDMDRRRGIDEDVCKHRRKLAKKSIGELEACLDIIEEKLS